MIRVGLFLSLFLTGWRVWAQPDRYGNGWIRPGQTYYRIPVTQRALYRLTTADLRRAGLPVETLDPTTLQMFRRGVEQAITVAGEADRRLDPADYLEFIGEGNDGAQDSLLYRPRGRQPHPLYSMYCDTAAYFLTWRTDGIPGRRMTTGAEPLPAGEPASPLVWETRRMLLTEEYSFKDIAPPTNRYEVFFEEGEGWTGPVQTKGVPFRRQIRLDGWHRSGTEKPLLELLLNGRDNTAHAVSVFVGPGRRWLGTVRFAGFQTPLFRAVLEPDDVAADSTLTVETVSAGPEPADRYSVSYVLLQYPRHTDLAGALPQTLTLPPEADGRALLELTHAPDSLRVFDITDPAAPRRLTGLRRGTTLQVLVTGTETTRRCWLTTGVQTPTRPERVVFRQLDPVRPNYLVVTHESLTKPVGSTPDAVRAYAGYRASAAGGGYDTLVVTFRELVNQFGYGERTPLALRRFADYMLTAHPAAGRRDKFLLLVGRANGYYPIRRNPNRDRLDLVPSLAYMPGSDGLLTGGLAGLPDYLNAMPVGRLNTLRPQEVLNYLTKVQTFESTPPTAPWRKEVLHLSGGRTASEQETFRRIMDAAGRTAQGQFLGAALTTRFRQTDAPIEKVAVADVVNRGVGLLTLFGHSSPVSTDTDLGYASDPAAGYRNTGRYPLLFFNGCGIGNIFFGATNNLSTDWLLVPDRGAIAVLAHGYTGYVGQLDNFTRVFYETLLGDSLWMPRPIGLVHQETTRRMLQRFPNELDLANVSQMVFQGDPALRIFPLPLADFVLSPEGLSRSGDAPDSVRLRVVITNAGRFSPGERAVLALRRAGPSGSWSTVGTLPGRAVAFRDTLELAFRPDSTPGRTAYELVIDPDDRIAELDESNNRLGFELIRSGGQFALILPDTGQRFPPDRLNPLLEVTFDGARLADGGLVSPSPLIRVRVWDEDRYRIRRDTTGIELLLKRPCARCAFERVWLGGPEVGWSPAGTDNRFVLDYRPRDLADGLYTLRVLATDVAGNPAGAEPYQIRFRVRRSDSLSAVEVLPNPFQFVTAIRFTVTGARAEGVAQVVIRTVTGTTVRILQQTLRVGENLFVWDGTDAGGAQLPAGVYRVDVVLPDGRRQKGKAVVRN